ncbi:hypothetical protein FHR92_005348 [Fontibacillus solani]|uniref:Uncharacterized protein n=1 Tax=Fontibacillus solani TaxID=1572857 RepID=A0A7W3SZ41_9BACL|nr:hypothetical protein [Fontibacillus solani]MBA9088813.1 hypothetical protein [Fontibacillus solani]
MQESLRMVFVSTDMKISKCRLSIFFRGDCCKLVLDSHKQFIVESSNYSSAMEELLIQLPKNTSITMEHEVVLVQNDSRVIIQLAETVELEYIPRYDSKVVKFTLCHQRGGKQQVCVSSYEDFGIVLGMLDNELFGKFEICAYCSKGDFKSDGGEDLRHGWYCFRKVDNIDMDKSWYERLDEFDQAIPNMSVFYWCPKFTYKNKKFI